MPSFDAQSVCPLQKKRGGGDGEILSEGSSDDEPRSKKKRGRKASDSEPELDGEGNPVPKQKKKRRYVPSIISLLPVTTSGNTIPANPSAFCGIFQHLNHVFCIPHLEILRNRKFYNFTEEV